MLGSRGRFFQGLLEQDTPPVAVARRGGRWGRPAAGGAVLLEKAVSRTLAGPVDMAWTRITKQAFPSQCWGAGGLGGGSDPLETKTKAHVWAHCDLGSRPKKCNKIEDRS